MFTYENSLLHVTYEKVLHTPYMSGVCETLINALIQSPLITKRSACGDRPDLLYYYCLHRVIRSRFYTAKYAHLKPAFFPAWSVRLH